MSAHVLEVVFELAGTLRDRAQSYIVSARIARGR
jgi:hypothetical protein